MICQINELLPRFFIYEELFSNHIRVVNAVTAAFLDVLKFCTQAKATFRKGSKACWSHQ
jgi:hypothetical protein